VGGGAVFPAALTFGAGFFTGRLAARAGGAFLVAFAFFVASFFAGLGQERRPSSQFGRCILDGSRGKRGPMKEVRWLLKCMSGFRIPPTSGMRP
jgi:hypothetical protein